MAKTRKPEKANRRRRSATQMRIRYKGVTIIHSKAGYTVLANGHRSIHATLTAAKRAVDKWEHAQYIKDRRKF